MDYKKVYKDNYYDNLVVKNLHTGALKVGDEIITANGVGDLGQKYKFSFDPDNLENNGVCSANFFISETAPENIDTRLSNIYQFQMNTTDLSGKDLTTLFRLLNNNEYLGVNMLDIINIYKPQNRGKYYISGALNLSYQITPFIYRGFKYAYRILSPREYPTTTQLLIFEAPGQFDSVNFESTNDIYDDFVKLENIYETPTIAFVALYNKSQTPFSFPELDNFVKRYVDNVLMTATTIAPIETMKENFYSKYAAIRGDFDLYKDFKIIDNEEYSYVPTITISPGTGLQVTLSYYNQYYNITYNGGSGYTNSLVGKTFTVPGTSLGGLSPVNDAVIKVNSVSSGVVSSLQLVSGVADYLKYDHIDDGGNYRYDNGNFLYYDTMNTFGLTLPYNHGEIVVDKFGPESAYCCVYNDSIFSLIITGNGSDINNRMIRFYTGGAFGDSTDTGISLSGRRGFQYVDMGLVPIVTNGHFNENEIYSVNLSHIYYDSLPAITAKKKEKTKEAQDKYKTFKPILKKLAAAGGTKMENHEPHEPMKPLNNKQRGGGRGGAEKQIDVSRRNRNVLGLSIRD